MVGELAGDRSSVWTAELAEPYGGASQRSRIAAKPCALAAGDGMKYELPLISHLMTVLTSAVSYLVQECRGIWIISEQIEFCYILP